LRLEGRIKELEYSVKLADKRAEETSALGVVCSERNTTNLEDYKACCLSCLDCAIEEKLDLGHWPTDINSGGKSEATNATPAATEQEEIGANIDAMSAAEIADELKEAEYGWVGLI
jgi:hypothetical protein